MFSKDFKRERVSGDELVKKLIPWYCNICWQEGEVTIEVPRKEFKEFHDPIKIRACQIEHDSLIRGITGAKCVGYLLPQLKKVKKRVKREVPPELAGLDESPITLK